MLFFRKLSRWYNILPILAGIFYFTGLIGSHWFASTLGVFFLFSSVIASVHHAEVIAERVGEPYGTIILAICITVLEVGLIVSFMLSGSEGALTYARDTVFAAVMLILNGILGICILVGGIRYREQFFARSSATTYLVSIITLLTLTLILPNYTSSVKGPVYNDSQLVFISIVCVIVYGIFLMVQTVRHRNYFIPEEEEGVKVSHSEQKPTLGQTILSLFVLLISLAVVIFMAKSLSPIIEDFVKYIGAPKSLVGVIIASVVLLPEGLAAVNAARKNQIQSSVNLALGSALASIGLTIPVISILCVMYDLPFILGIDSKATILVGLSMFVAMLSLSRGKTNILYGTVLLTILATYVFFVVFP